MSAPEPLELTFCRATVPNGAQIAAGVEMSGRGYKRMPTGALLPSATDPNYYVSALSILWPQALTDWGGAIAIAALSLATGNVTASYPVAITVRTGDQIRIGRQCLAIAGVGPNTKRPYSTGRYGISQFSKYPAAGAILWVAARVDFAWAQQGRSCAPWPAVPATVVGGCIAA